MSMSEQDLQRAAVHADRVGREKLLEEQKQKALNEAREQAHAAHIRQVISMRCQGTFLIAGQMVAAQVDEAWDEADITADAIRLVDEVMDKTGYGKLVVGKEEDDAEETKTEEGEGESRGEDSGSSDTEADPRLSDE